MSPGEKITVNNQDSVAHTLTDDTVFDTGSISPAGSATLTAPSAPGSYNFIGNIDALRLTAAVQTLKQQPGAQNVDFAELDDIIGAGSDN